MTIEYWIQETLIKLGYKNPKFPIFHDDEFTSFTAYKEIGWKIGFGNNEK